MWEYVLKNEEYIYINCHYELKRIDFLVNDIE
jgi:hypothetical protein